VTPSAPPEERLRADCSRCAGLCCVAPAFSASSDFAITKPAGTPCPNLGADFGCTIHAQLRPRGFPGCTVFDCFGAGQKVVQGTFDGRNWRDTPAIASQMFASFHVMRDLHELLWYLTEALTLAPARPVHDELRAALDEITRLTDLPPGELVQVDVRPRRERVGTLLLRASELVRAGRRGPDRRNADLVGKDLRRADLRGANLRGAYLIGSDLRGADLRLADLIGADLRGAMLGGADLRGSIFLTQSQLDAATGDRATRLPATFARPGHWAAAAGR
jgi:uncharacterized protein YjbI with pentapeptide repeats